jgi:hypothetical protein
MVNWSGGIGVAVGVGLGVGMGVDVGSGASVGTSVGRAVGEVQAVSRVSDAQSVMENRRNMALMIAQDGGEAKSLDIGWTAARKWGILPRVSQSDAEER